jgi:hypothetical protein
MCEVAWNHPEHYVMRQFILHLSNRVGNTDTQIRDELIRRFVFTNDLSHRALHRFQQANAANPTELDEAGFQYLVRPVSEQGLL